MPSTDQLIQAASQHLARGQREDARGLLEAAVEQDPAYAPARQHLGLLMAQMGKFPEAVSHLEVAARAMPRDAGLQCNLGMLKSSQGLMEEAEVNFRAAVSLNPGFVDAHACLGLLLSNRQRAKEAEEVLRRAVSLAPGRGDIVHGLTRLLTETGRAEESVAVIRAAQRVNPHDAFLQDKLCMMLNYIAGVSDEELLREHRRYGELAPKPDGDFSRVNRDPERRLRVGYLSADLREHAVSYFLEAILEGHDRKAVEVVVFHIGAGDEATKRMRGKADKWLPLFPCPDEQLLAAMRAEGVDILVELAGHTASNRLPVVSRRAAPVQVTYIGYPNTTGVPAIDYRIIDTATDPPGAERWATEKLVRLEPCFLCYRAAETAPPVQPRPATGPVMFGSFNNLAKLSPQTADLWSAVLKAVPESKLVLKGKALADDSIAARFYERFASRGIGTERLECLQHTPATGEHLGAYAKVDIALDPFPYSGTTTTCEAMWMGVPVVTMEGSRHSSRVGVSLLRTVELPELIARTPEEYLAIATGLANDRARLAALRSTLRERVRSSPLCDIKAFVPKLEAAYRAMWRTWCSSPPGAR